MFERRESVGKAENTLNHVSLIKTLNMINSWRDRVSFRSVLFFWPWPGALCLQADWLSVPFLYMRYLKNYSREFIQIWNKCPM